MIDGTTSKKISDLKHLYNAPLPSNRSGALYNAFSYPTKISPEAVAIFIACHTNPGETILDPFSGSGSTGLAAKLCDKPTQFMLETAERFGLSPKWGKRTAILYELSASAAFTSNVLCSPPDPKEFEKSANQLLIETENELDGVYSVLDDEGLLGNIRYVIWSEVLACPVCKTETTFWDAAVSEEPLGISSEFQCKNCNHVDNLARVERVVESFYDQVLKQDHVSKKRVPVKIYGRTGKRNWSRPATTEDQIRFKNAFERIDLSKFPNHKITWGMLFRRGYHNGISHLHHFYTRRNAYVFSKLWDRIQLFPVEHRDALKVLLLSYNSSHSTLMTRVVVKKNSKDFIITGSQSGVLYISNIPVEKNLFEGIRRKIATLKQAFSLVRDSESIVQVAQKSSTKLDLRANSIDYVFTDPPFGDYIPYSEINQINDAWLGNLSDAREEVVVNPAQSKGIHEYRSLMTRVFQEIERVLKNSAPFTLVFHSAKAEVWEALVNSYGEANFQVAASSILDKVQGSFKQVNSEIKVQGDPLLLLVKSHDFRSLNSNIATDADLIDKILQSAFLESDETNERKPERLFSRYINACLENGKKVMLDASEFYEIIKGETIKYQPVSIN